MKQNHLLIEHFAHAWTGATCSHTLPVTPPSSEHLEPATASSDRAESVFLLEGSLLETTEVTEQQVAGEMVEHAIKGELEGEQKSLEFLLRLVDFSSLFEENSTYEMNELINKLRSPFVPSCLF